MQVVSQLATIYVDSPVSLFTPQNHKSLVNMSFGQFVTNDEVILPVCVGETFPTSVQVMLPARFRVNTCFQVNAALKWVNLFVTLDRVNKSATLDWVNKSATHTWVNTCVQVNDALKWVNLFATLHWVNKSTTHAWVNTCVQVNDALKRVNLFATLDQVNKSATHACVNTCVPVIPAVKWANILVTLVWGNTCNQMNHAIKEVNVSVCHVQVKNLVNYSIALKWVNNVAGQVQMVISTHIWADVLVDHILLNRITVEVDLIEYIYCSVSDVDVQMNKSNDSQCLCHCYTMCFPSNQQDWPSLTEYQDTLWQPPTARYDAVDYPFFIFHQKQLFLNFSETLKLYADHLSQYQLVKIIVFVIHWCNYWCHFVLNNMALLINFDLTPQQHCMRAYLTMCQSQYYKHDFAVVSTALSFSTNIVIVGFVKYAENILCLLFRHKYISSMFVDPSFKGNFKSQIHNDFTFTENNVPNKIGGGHQRMRVENIDMQFVNPYIIYAPVGYSDFKKCEFVRHLEKSEALTQYDTSVYIVCDVPLHLLVGCLFHDSRASIGKQHNICILKRMSRFEITQKFKIHDETCEHQYVSVLHPHSKMTNIEHNLEDSEIHKPLVKNDFSTEEPVNLAFPPAPPDPLLRKKIINKFCEATSPSKFEEAGCAVCGSLTLRSGLSELNSLDIELNVLNTAGQGLTRKERKFSTEPITELNGNVIDTSCHYICVACKERIRHGKIPKFALARGLWLGEIPKELQQLSFAEKLLVSRVRHNRCVVRVGKGMHKMIANAVMFEHPMQKIYSVLPPPIEEMDELLAFIFTGPCQPTEDDFRRTPFLVRRNKVARALEWLKLNHKDYSDLEISYKNLASYPEDLPPVVINYRHSTTNKIPEATSVHDMELEHGTAEGMCPFTVHTLTSEEYDTTSSETLKAIAVKHLDEGGKVLAIGHSKEPQSIWKNPKLYPQMFPWLFPYGLGGIGHQRQKYRLSDAEHKRHLLMYHDKRFQKDSHFPLIAFNHEQIKDSTKAGFIMAKQKSFENIANRLLQINSDVLADITERMIKGERVKGDSQEEKDCLQLIHDLDRIGGHVKGSITSKKYMRNEIWSLISFQGAPSWYITLSPADNKHPISLYYADTKEEFTPVIRSKSEKDRLIADNPVASARFFHFMIQAFIKHVLGVDTDHAGIYGDTSSYYGTVEQQGRLTLHLHMLLWIRGALTPQEIRDRIMDPESDFQKKMVEYLESVHMGEFITGSLEDVKQNLDIAELDDQYKNPTETLPIPPPPQCNQNGCGECKSCQATSSWESQFSSTVDDILLRSNIHKCTGGSKQFEKKKMKHKDKNTVNKYQPITGCLSNKWGKCKAHFPRKTFEHTEVNMANGALNIKKGESMLNTVTAEVTYLIRSNTDVTSLLSGTAIKAVVAYVSDYISKPALKTYLIFEAVKNVFDRNSEMLGGSLDRKEKARILLTQIVNNLTSKMEIGGPMASMYLLKNPDHYTNHKFRTFYWPNFVRAARYAWNPDSEEYAEDQLVLLKIKGKIVGRTLVQDYVFRPVEYSHVSLYDWIHLSLIEKCSKKVDQNSFHDDIDETESDKENNVDSDNENNKVTFHCFLEDHPLHHSHHATLLDDMHEWVPNFVGGAIPRSDRGDREYYCSTMLTFFKPWHTGKDLKLDGQSWDDAFRMHKFNSRQLDIMKYFNVRYECLDARDDCASQMKKGENVGIFSNWDIYDNLDSDLVDDNSFESDDFTFDINFVNEDAIGPKTEKRNRDMLHVEQIMRNAGWFDKSTNGPADVGDLTPVVPDQLQSGKDWRAVVQQKRQEIIDKRCQNIPENIDDIDKTGYDQEPSAEVKIVDKAYLTAKFKAKVEKEQNITDNTVSDFLLNTEQERSFRIIANHASTKTPEQLIMYVGGMAGTGKSQVIKSLIEFFERRNESHRIIITAPTGTAAALVGGSTYHSILGINDKGAHNISMAKVRTRLDGVDYIFLDEVSMLSCHDLYNISAQLAKAFNEPNKPFGGLNMIFSGDFSQLPPVGGGESISLYSGSIGTQIHSGLSHYGQESAIGKALWHQVTTVVLLRENMRQRLQSPEDAKFHKALENMRYKACTQEDIAFLRTWTTGPGTNKPKLAEKNFRNVSIITAWNSQKDRINELGSARFAKETKQCLVDFYSIDKWVIYEDIPEKVTGRKRRKRVKATENSTNITHADQEKLWELPHHATQHFPGKLSLCIGMPVMLRNNDATELCITKGQEGTVAGWQSCLGPHGKLVLDTLFVRLTSPPHAVKLDGLPENVVPIPKMSHTIECTMKSDQIRKVEREQCCVLPNFSMTDYGSQGKTRPYNPVDLQHSNSHQSYYTCLSRSATAEGTLIVQSFQPSVITGGCSGWLRQEFRDLELLDEITRLQFLSQLVPDIDGHCRNTLIRQFRTWKGLNYVPESSHPAIKWSTQQPNPLEAEVQDIPWKIVNRKENLNTNLDNSMMKASNSFMTAKGSMPLLHKTIKPTGTKCKTDNQGELHVTKRVKTFHNSSTDAIKRKNENESDRPKKKQKLTTFDDDAPPGSQWDENNYSCAYDALFTILFNIWVTKPKKWMKIFQESNQYLSTLHDGFQKYLRGMSTLEVARDNVRTLLHENDPVLFPSGHAGSSVSALATQMFYPVYKVPQLHLQCSHCNHTIMINSNHIGRLMHVAHSATGSISQILENHMRHQSQQTCGNCNAPLGTKIHFSETHKIYAVDVTDRNVTLSRTVKIQGLVRATTLHLKGLVYHGGYHFTCRIIDESGNIWFHDGITTGRMSTREGKMGSISQPNLKECKNKQLCLVIYGHQS